jgi:hypothetical protein
MEWFQGIPFEPIESIKDYLKPFFIKQGAPGALFLFMYSWG